MDKDNEIEYNNPLVYQRADPFVYRHTDGYYYFTGTMPQYDCIEIRRAKTLNELLTADSYVVWKKHTTGEMGSHIWAPELHYIDDTWYIYFTAGDSIDIWQIRPYVLMCRDKNPITGKWIEIGRIDVGIESFSLDMTTFVHKGVQYVLWAQKLVENGPSNVYIAKMKNPWTLATKPMLLTTPEYYWEKQGFEVDEGPAVLIRNGKVIVTYSASDTSWRYCMGMLWADADSDLMDRISWHKSDRPVFMTCEENEQYGPGHNCFTSDNGKDVLIYHSRNYKEVDGDPLQDNNRHARAKAFDYDENGLPVFGEPVKKNI
ncbi:MAG: family 43 glycosylhydrolase [Firmicutes bacterium]|nr:family 43 glycosylhydrolase [Bacillota bacterium]